MNCSCGHDFFDHGPIETKTERFAEGGGTCQHVDCDCEHFTTRGEHAERTSR